jgi:hypothetical protein
VSKPVVIDDVQAVRGLYSYLRSHVAVTNRGWANLLWRAWDTPNPPTFLVGSNGEAIHVPCARAALIAELRLVLLEQGFPLAFVAQWDRTDN